MFRCLVRFYLLLLLPRSLLLQHTLAAMGQPTLEGYELPTTPLMPGGHDHSVRLFWAAK